ncbi:MAG: HAD family phosphatase [Pseudomonadota bacterium]
MTKPRRAFIFDMDGTIVDNMAYHTRSWIAFFERRGRTIDADKFFRATAGRQGKEIMRAYLGDDLSDHDNAVLNEEKEAVYRELYEPYRKAVKGFDNLVANAQLRDVALAVATAAPDANIGFTLDGLNLRQHFHAIVGAADVARGKPEPDAFLMAAKRCGVEPKDCIVFEDAPLGVEAALRAGMRAVALTTTLPADAFAHFDNVIHIVKDFSELPVEALFRN